jgi:spore coat polysaccharide biosynthesis protein SpsF
MPIDAKLAIFIQARMSSTRCPGKMMADIGGRPMLQRVVDRFQGRLGLETIVVTSEETSDDLLSTFCRESKISCFRGPLDDVVARYLLAGEAFGVEHVIRICGDSPWIDNGVVQALLEVGKNESADVFSNVSPRSFPKGQSVESFSLDLLRDYHGVMDTQDLEHVTRYFYRHPEQFSIFNMKSERDYSHLDMTVDQSCQLEICRKIHKLSEGRCWSLSHLELIETYGEHFCQS